MVLDTSLLNTPYYKIRIKGKVEQSRKRTCTLSVLKLLKRKPLGHPTWRLEDEWRPSKLQHYWEWPEYRKEYWRLEETCCHSDSSEKSSAKTDVKNSQWVNNNNNNLSNNNNKVMMMIIRRWWRRRRRRRSGGRKSKYKIGKLSATNLNLFSSLICWNFCSFKKSMLYYRSKI